MPIDPPDGATPLDPDEAEGLLQRHVSTRGELNELERENIQMGLEWAIRVVVTGGRRRDVLTEDFIYELHRRMFGEVWEWAGEPRRTNKNLGVDKFQIRPEIRKLIADAELWRKQEVFDIEEIAVRFHHRLVWIHPFPNGNGRHARLMADLIAQREGHPPFSWGGGSLVTTPELRRTYISALRAADQGDLAPLMDFARS